MQEEKQGFEFSYSAPTEDERREVESIKRGYLSKTEKESKLEKIRALDNKVKRMPTTVALTLGIIGTLIFGLGMTCVLEWGRVGLGVALGLVGGIVALIAYPIYKCVHNSNKAKYGEEILKLAEEILKKD